MRIDIISEAVGWGGTEAHALELARVLAARGHAASLVCFGQDVFSRRLGGPDDVEVRALTAPRRTALLSSVECAGLARSLRGDVCVLEKGGVGQGSWRLDWALRMRYRRLVTIENLCPPLPQKPGGHNLRVKLRRHVRSWAPSQIVCVSGAVRDQLAREYRFPAGKMTTIRNGIDPTRFRPDEALRQSARHSLGIAEGALVYGAIGRLDKIKGYATAVAAFARLSAEHPGRDLRLLLAGDGPDRDELRQQAAGLGVASQVLFPGFVERPWELYPAIDLFVMPSLNEGLPLALLEAMACGCCPIAMATAGIPEVITNPRLGWLVPSGDAEQFFRAMADAAQTDDGQRQATRTRARSCIVERFDARTQFAALADLVEGSPAARANGAHFQARAAVAQLGQ
jgi:glycosyltransferase involved in cell wall biosynthesis